MMISVINSSHNLSITHITKITDQTFLLPFKEIIKTIEVKIEPMEAITIREMAITLVVEEVEGEEEVEVLLEGIDMMVKEINIKDTEVKKQDTSHRENYRRHN